MVRITTFDPSSELKAEGEAVSVAVVEIAAGDVDKTQSHILVARLPSGWFGMSGAIAHPDILEPTLILPRSFKHRQRTIMVAAEFAKMFDVPQVYLVKD